jgi:hypothetical protein
MSKPLRKQIDPAEPGQIKTMFVTEGIPDAVLVIEGRRGFFRENYWFTAPEHALAWCRRQRCNFVYAPSVPVN